MICLIFLSRDMKGAPLDVVALDWSTFNRIRCEGNRSKGRQKIRFFVVVEYHFMVNRAISVFFSDVLPNHVVLFM